MIIKNYKIPNFSPSYPIEKLGDINSVLFVDIETTGLSPTSASIYLLGCCYFENGQWMIRQWLCENIGEERELLQAFLNHLTNFDTLIHFNGNKFDLPFIEKRASLHGLPISFEGITGIDIYKRIYPYRHFLRLTNCKQKTLEEFLSIHREDMYSGGELISVYKSFCTSHDEESLGLLLQHNRDDVYGMIRLLPILTYADFFNEPLTVRKVESNITKDAFGKTQKEILIYFSLNTELPKSISCHGNDCYFSGRGNEGMIKVPVFTEEMKFFYSDYKNYYYLPNEDMAIHKSVSTFVDPAFREKATAATCYTRKTGDYLPQWEFLFEPFFKREYDSKSLFFELTDSFKENREAFSRYASHILSMMMHIH